MNLIGKIFTVLIFVLALVFMTLTVLVYATHKNWRTVALNSRDKPEPGYQVGLVWQVEDLKRDKENLTAQLDRDNRRHAQESSDKDARLAKADNDIVELNQQRLQLEREKATLTDDKRKAVGAMNAAQAEADKFSREALALRKDLEMAQKDRRLHEKEVNRLIDEDQQLRDEYKTLNAKQLILAADLAKAQNVLRHFGMNISTDITGTPPSVNGVIEAVPGKGLVEINLGSDDGLMKGHVLEVVRAGPTAKYVGRIEVVQVAADRAVCRIDPKYQKSNMQVDDRVFSKLE